MLKKLLKYDIKYKIKNMMVFYILTIFFAILTRIFFAVDNTIMTNIISKICLGCAISMMINIIINTIMRCYLMFSEVLYKDPSYLTHTLPVSKKDIYESKFIQTIVFLLIGFIIILIGIFIIFYSKENYNILVNFLNTICNSINLNTTFILLSLGLILFLEFFNIIQSGYLGIILGHKKNNSKIGFSVLFGFIIYTVSQIIVLLIIFMYGLINNNIMDLFTSNQILDINVFKSLIIVSTIGYVIITTIMNIICVKLLNKGVDIE